MYLKNILKLSIFSLFLLPIVAKAFYLNDAVLPYTDVDKFDEHFPSIEYFTKNNVVSGYNDGHFGSDETVNRAEALKIIFGALDIDLTMSEEASMDSNFQDISPNDWFAKYVYKAHSLNIVQGYSDSNFHPGKNVNLVEALKMILTASNNKSLPMPEKDPASDVAKDDWYATYVKYAVDNDIVLRFVDYSIRPARDLTRGELLDILYRFLLKDNRTEIVYSGLASYYSDSLEGNNTASGEVFDQDLFTAANRTFDFGTKLILVNVDTGATVEVRVNDRGPYSDKFDLDLSSSAFEALAPLSRGIVRLFYYVSK